MRISDWSSDVCSSDLLTQVAIDLMDGLDENATDFRPTYNGEDEEPELFPGAFPNLLANGAAGIAVGMATSVPPHNAAELLDAAILLLHQPKADDAAVLGHVNGPDFPTGGRPEEPTSELQSLMRISYAVS